MKELSMTSLLNSINIKFIRPAIAQRKHLLFDYLNSIGEENAAKAAIDFHYMKGVMHLNKSNVDWTYEESLKKMYLHQLPDYNQVESLKHIKIINDLYNTSTEIKVYLSYLNNKSSNLVDIAYALPPHINQLVPIETPANFETHNLRDPKVYGLLNELQIKLLLLT